VINCGKDWKKKLINIEFPINNRHKQNTTMPITRTINALDLDDVKTHRQERKSQVDKSNVKLVCFTGNQSSKTLQEPVQPPINSFENVKKPKTRAERRFVEDEEDANAQTVKLSPKRQRRTDHWVVQDTLRINRSRRLKQLESAFPLTIEDEED
jgi:hypothetical protein